MTTPRPYIISALLFALLAGGCFWASLNAWASLELNRAGIDPMLTAQELAALFALALVLAASRSLRGFAVGLARKVWSVPLPLKEEGPRARYDNFDGLRLILALSVAFFHAHNHVLLKPTGLFAAVPCFLAISGFVVLQSFEYSSSWIHFAWKRFLRVMPAFFASLLLTGVILGWLAVFGTLRTWATLGLGTDLNNQGNGVVWSLSCEELFYAGLAIIYLCGGYRRPAVVWSLLVVSVIFALRVLPGSSLFVQNAVVLAPAFWAGNLLFMYRERLQRLPKFLPGIALAVTGMAFFVRGDNIDIQFLHQCLFTASLIWFAAFGPQILPRLKNDLSYGIYIYHMPLLLWLLSMNRLGRRGLIVATIAAAVAVAAVSWFGLERYALRLKDWRLGLRSVPSATVN